MILLAETSVSSFDAQSVIWMAVATFGAGLLAVLTKILSAWGDAQIAKLKNDDLRGKVTLAKNEIGDVVYMISQVLVPEVKAAAADGRVTPEEREKLQRRAIELARERFSPEFWNSLMEHLGVPVAGLDEWILGQVESRVFRMKMDIGGHPGEQS
jgi:hypothetical protein